MLLIVIVLLYSATLLLGFIDSDGARYWLQSLGLAFVLLSVLLIVVPGIAFLIYSVSRRDQGVSRRLRYTATASAVAPALVGSLVVLTYGEGCAGSPCPELLIAGWSLLAVAAAIVLRAWTTSSGNASANDTVVGYKYALAGIWVPMVVLLIAIAIGRSHRFPVRVYLKSDGYITAMKSDLLNLVSAQEDYFEDHRRYTTDLVALWFRRSTGVNAPIVVVGPDWWSATNTHSQLSKTTCGIAVNTTNPVVATAPNGLPACK
jgi:hypothetical protein